MLFINTTPTRKMGNVGHDDLQSDSDLERGYEPDLEQGEFDDTSEDDSGTPSRQITRNYVNKYNRHWQYESFTHES